MNYAVMHSIATVFAVLAFAGICWWAYRPANRQRFEQVGHLPLDTDPLFKREEKNSGSAGHE